MATQEQIIQQVKSGEILKRSFHVERTAIDVERRTVVLAFASEEPAERWFGLEVLVCDRSAVRVQRLERGTNLLVDHEWSDVVGVIESFSFGTDRVIRAVVRFGKSARAEEIFQDVVDGIRTNVSVGYRIYDLVLQDSRDGVETYRVTDWEPYEISMVSVPADIHVGVGRSAQMRSDATESISQSISQSKQEVNTMSAENEAVQTAASTPAPAAVLESAVLTAAHSANVQVMESRNHAKEIAAIAQKNPKLTDIAMRAIQGGSTVEAFQTEAIRAMADGGLPTAEIGLSASEQRRYSLTRAMNALANPQDAQAQSAAAFEWECSAQASRQLGKPAQGLIVPYDVQKRDAANVGTPAAGGHTVATNLSSNYIDELSNRLVVSQLGATILDGLVGDMAIPRHLGGVTTSWVGESQEGDESAGQWDQVPLTPKTITGYTDLSRKLLKQSSIAIDSFCQTQLVKQIALGIQAALFSGAGNQYQPQGLLKFLPASRVLAIGANGGKPNYGHIIDLETMVAAEDADEGSLAYLTNAKVRGLLKKTEKFSTTNGSPIWDGNEMNGYPAHITNAIPSKLTKGTSVEKCSAIAYGNWADLFIALWGGLDLVVDPYSKSKSGSIRFVAHQDVDFAYAHAQSFAVIVDALTE